VSKERDKGTGGERTWTRTLVRRGHTRAARIDHGGPESLPDVSLRGEADRTVVFQVKVVDTPRLVAWWDLTKRQGRSVGAKVMALVWHRPGYGRPEDWLVVTDGRTFLDLLDAWESINGDRPLDPSFAHRQWLGMHDTKWVDEEVDL
jgi:hypothetical protein